MLPPIAHIILIQHLNVIPVFLIVIDIFQGIIRHKLRLRAFVERVFENILRYELEEKCVAVLPEKTVLYRL